MKKLGVFICIIVLGLAGGAGMYLWQNGKADSLRAGSASLQKQLSTAQHTYDVVAAAQDIKTDSWKKYCDSVSSFCFSYPADWTLKDNTVEFAPNDKRVGATLTSPGGTVTINYSSPLIKDGGYASAHIVDVSEVATGAQKLKLIGSYPVASGQIGPGYYYVNTDASAGGAPGSVGHGFVNPRFGVGKYDAILFTASYTGKKKITTPAQAEAWFKSVDGKTAKAILSSFKTK